MNVPPPQPIVCALPAQNSVRHIVLAAAALGLCGAASAQSAPAAPLLSLWDAVEITHGTTPDVVATLERSAALELWQAAAPPVYGNGDEFTHLVPAGAAPQGFLRVKFETRPAVGYSRWQMTGSRLLLNTKDGLRALTFEADGIGAASTAQGQNGFTWAWQRTGRDTGRLTLTWPDDVTEMVDFQFTALNAGVFTSERYKGGVPDGAFTGAFRDEAGAGFDVSAPAAPGDATVVLSGTGRPVSVSLSAVGTAHISSPAGPRDYDVSYALMDKTTTAELSLTCYDGSTETCTLIFTGPACGTYVSQSRLHGGLRRSGGGAFTIAPR